MLATTVQQKMFMRLLSKPENLKCADCSSKSPSWASIDFGVFICLNCSGAHRALGPSVTRVRSTKLDTWQAEWITLMEIGNEKCNAYWQANIGLASKPTANSSLESIKRFVADKYLKRKYVRDGDLDPVSVLKASREPQKGPTAVSHSVSPTSQRDPPKRSLVKPCEFQILDPFKKEVPVQSRPREKSVNLFDFEDDQVHKNVHIGSATAATLHLHPQPLKTPNQPATSTASLKSHSLDYATLGNQFHNAFNLSSNGQGGVILPSGSSGNHHGRDSQFHSMSGTGGLQTSQFPQHKQQNVFRTGNFSGQHQSFPSPFQFFGKQMSNQGPVQVINMYANNINFNFGVCESRAQEKRDPFSTLDEFDLLS